MTFIGVGRRVLILTVALVLLVVAVWVVATNQARAGSATPVVYVATGENFPDALGAGPAAATVEGPVLLVRLNSIPGVTGTELTRLGPDKIIIVGGTGVISASVETALGAFAPTVERISGADRYETAAKLSEATFPSGAGGSDVAAAVHMTRDGFDAPVVEDWFNNVNGTMPTVSGSSGFYEVEFGFDARNSFPLCSIDTNFVDTRDAVCSVSTPNATEVWVRTRDASANALAPAEFWLVLFGS